MFFALTWITSFAQDDSVYVVFSEPGGFYKNGVLLQISCSVPDAKIYYTTDGSAPSSASFRYSEPIQISNVVTPIRAKAYVNGLPTPIITHTYFTERNYTTPVIAINTQPEFLFSDSLGILSKGCCADSVPPYYGANFWKGWEREINIELYESDGTLAFNQAAGFRVFGGWSKSLPQKSLAIIARTEYGNNRFEYPIFPDRPMAEYKTFILRNSGSDFNVTHFRDAFLTQLSAPLNVDIQEYRPAAVYLNGQYWGIMNIREKLNEHYLEGNFGVDKDSVDLMKHRMDLQEGTRDNYRALLKFLKENDLSIDSNMQVINNWIDIDNYLDYNIAEIYIDNRDAGGNIRYWRSQSEGSQWRWILFDTDMSYGVTDWDGYDHDAVAMNLDPSGPAWPNPPWSTFIIRKLLENNTVWNTYLNKWADHLNTTYHPDSVNALLDEFVASVQTEMYHHVERWEPWGNDDINDWETNVNVMRIFGLKRPVYCRQHLLNYFNLPDTSFVTINVVGMGSVYFNSVHVTRRFSGIYFDSVTVSIKAIPDFNSTFVGWAGIEGDTAIEWLLEHDENITATFEPKPRSDTYGKIRITEISTADSISYDWIELYNNSSQSIDVSDWYICDSEYNRALILPAGTTIKPGEFLVLAENLPAFIAAFSDTIPAIGNLPFGISHFGEWIGVYDANLLPVDTFTVPELNYGEVLALCDPGMNDWVVDSPTPGRRNPKFPEKPEGLGTYLYYTVAGIILLVIVFFLVRGKSRKPKKIAISDHSESGS